MWCVSLNERVKNYYSKEQPVVKLINYRRAVVSLIMAVLSAVFVLPSTAQASTVDPDVIEITGYGLGPMVLSPDGETLAVSSWGSREVFLIDTTTNTVRSVIVGQTSNDQPGGLAFSPDGDVLYAVVYGTSVEVINVANATITDTLVSDALHSTAFDEVWSLSITRDGKTLMLGRYGLGGVVYFDLENEVVTNVFNRLNTATSQETASWNPPAIVNSQFLSPDGATVYMQGYNGAIDAYTATSDPALQRRLDNQSWLLTSGGVGVSDANLKVDSSCLSPDGATVYIPAGYDHDSVYKVDIASGIVIQEASFRAPNEQYWGQWGCAVSPDGTSLFVTQPNSAEPSIVVEYSTADLSAAPIIHEIPFSPGSNFGYTYGITVVGCDAYVSGFYEQIGVLRDIGCVPEINQVVDAASEQLAHTGSQASVLTVMGGIFSITAIVTGMCGITLARRIRRQH